MAAPQPSRDRSVIALFAAPQPSKERGVVALGWPHSKQAGSTMGALPSQCDAAQLSNLLRGSCYMAAASYGSNYDA